MNLQIFELYLQETKINSVGFGIKSYGGICGTFVRVLRLYININFKLNLIVTICELEKDYKREVMYHWTVFPLSLEIFY